MQIYGEPELSCNFFTLYFFEKVFFLIKINSHRLLRCSSYAFSRSTDACDANAAGVTPAYTVHDIRSLATEKKWLSLSASSLTAVSSLHSPTLHSEPTKDNLIQISGEGKIESRCMQACVTTVPATIASSLAKGTACGRKKTVGTFGKKDAKLLCSSDYSLYFCGANGVQVSAEAVSAPQRPMAGSAGSSAYWDRAPKQQRSITIYHSFISIIKL